MKIPNVTVLRSLSETIQIMPSFTYFTNEQTGQTTLHPSIRLDSNGDVIHVQPEDVDDFIAAVRKARNSAAKWKESGIPTELSEVLYLTGELHAGDTDDDPDDTDELDDEPEDDDPQD